MNNEKYQQGFTDKIETLKQKEDSLIENGVAQHLAGLLNGIEIIRLNILDSRRLIKLSLKRD